MGIRRAVSPKTCRPLSQVETLRGSEPSTPKRQGLCWNKSNPPVPTLNAVQRNWRKVLEPISQIHSWKDPGVQTQKGCENPCPQNASAERWCSLPRAPGRRDAGAAQAGQPDGQGRTPALGKPGAILASSHAVRGWALRKPPAPLPRALSARPGGASGFPPGQPTPLSFAHARRCFR